jgi:2-octaprenylphenol hydroxylase
VAKPREPTVLIVGAGVVGLAVGALLATGRCADRLRVRVLEARPLPTWQRDVVDLRVYALSRASQRTLERLGVWDAVRLTRVCAYRRMHVWEGADPIGPGSLDFDCAEIGEPDLGHIVEDSLLRSELAALLSRAPSAEVTLGAEVESIEVGTHEVAVGLRAGGVLRGTLLVAADGSDSPVRRLLDLPVAALGYGQTALVTHVATEAPHRETAWQRFLPGGPLAFLPLEDGRSSIVWSLPTEEAEALLRAAEPEFLAALEAASVGVLGRLGPAAARGAFPLQALHARRYCAPRAALIGDAAHTVHPLAGQGMNLGLLDAACLAAVLEDALAAGEDPGDRRVLRRYELQRKGDNLQMLLAFDALNRLFRLPAWVAPLRTAGLAAVDASGAAKRVLMRRALGLNAGSKKPLRWSHALEQS